MSFGEAERRLRKVVAEAVAAGGTIPQSFVSVRRQLRALLGDGLLWGIGAAARVSWRIIARLERDSRVLPMCFPALFSGKQPIQEMPDFIGILLNFSPAISSTPESGH
jgi:hypothetical protein